MTGFEGGGGADTIDGGDGYDGASYYTSTAGVHVCLSNSTDSEGYIIGHRGGNAEGDRLKNIERLNGSNHNDTLTGDDQRNHFGSSDRWDGMG